MRQYLELMQYIRDHGNVITNERTGVGTKSIFGWMMRFDLKAGFPLVTTKKLHLRSIIHELLWMIAGRTDNQYLNDVGVTIWDEWALKEDQIENRAIPGPQLAQKLADKLGITLGEAQIKLNAASREPAGLQGGYALLKEHEIPLTQDVVVREKGDLGPIYGRQWRNWRTPYGHSIDQLQAAIDELRTNPGSRRNIVTAWNPADLPNAKLSPEDNVKEGKMSLAACHCMFQFRTRALSIEERIKAAADRGIGSWDWEIKQAESVSALLDSQDVPKFALSCMLTQRSADVFLGVPFNIASYALLTHMVAQVVNMVPDELVWSGGDVHLYTNHMEQVDLQLSREPLPLPTLKLNPAITQLEDFTFEDIEIAGYQYHPPIKAPVAK